MSADDAKKLDAVRSALRRDDIVEAGKHARLFELKPISVQRQRAGRPHKSIDVSPI